MGDTLLEQASLLVAGSADLKRVTIMSAQPDSTVVVQADYFSAHDDYPRNEVPSHDRVPTFASQLPAIQDAGPNALTPVIHEVRMSAEPPAASYLLKPTQLYARTQRGFDDTKTSVLDVLA
jgi:hypothetical protein